MSFRGVRLSSRFFALYGLLQVLGLMSFIVPEVVFLYLILLVILALITFRDLRSLIEPAEVSVSLRAPLTPHLGHTETLGVRLQAESERVLSLQELKILTPILSVFEFTELFQRWKPSIHDAEPIVEQHNAAVDILFRVKVRRLGYVQISSWPVEITSRFGMFQKLLHLPLEPIELRVAPERNRISEQLFQSMMQAQRRLSMGVRLFAKNTSPDQFHSVRKYQYPDPIRHIDHRKTARYGEPMTRVYDSLHNHHLVIALDLGRGLLGNIRDSRKCDFYLSAALALVESAVHKRDRVSFFTFASQAENMIRSARTLTPFLPLFRGAESVQPKEEESDYRLLAKTIQNTAGNRSIVIVLTDLARPSVRHQLLESLGSVSRRHLTVVLSLSDRDNELENHVLSIDPESLELKPLSEFKDFYADLLYRYWEKENQDLFMEHITRLGGLSLIVNDHDWMACVDRLYQLLRTSRFA